MVSVGSSLMRFAFPAGVGSSPAPTAGVPSQGRPLASLPPAESASDRARARLEEITERLRTLERMGFPPEVVSRQTAILGAEAARSASQVAGASPEEAAAPAAADTGTGTGAAAAEVESGADGGSLPPAYREVLAHRTAGLSDDATIRREFEALAARIRALQQRAEREAASLDRAG